MLVNWSAFTWDAFATLVTGALAVGAAALVGLRQLKVLQGQNDLKEQENRISLLEKRLEVYDEVHAFFSEIMRSGNEASPEISQRFIGAKLKARFLFSNELSDYLQEVWSKNCDLGLHRTMSRGGAAKDEEERIKHVHLGSETLKWFLDEFGKLHERFEEIRPS